MYVAWQQFQKTEYLDERIKSTQHAQIYAASQAAEKPSVWMKE